MDFPQDTPFVSHAVFPNVLEDAGGNDKFMRVIRQVKVIGVFAVDGFELKGLPKKVIAVRDVKKIVAGIAITRLLQQGRDMAIEPAPVEDGDITVGIQMSDERDVKRINKPQVGVADILCIGKLAGRNDIQEGLA